LMTLDSQSFQAMVQKEVTEKRPIPGASLVDNYIKAFYCQDNELTTWLREHQNEYTAKQLTSLVTLTSGSITNKAAKTALLKTLDDICLAKKKHEEAQMAASALVGVASTSTSSSSASLSSSSAIK